MLNDVKQNGPLGKMGNWLTWPHCAPHCVSRRRFHIGIVKTTVCR